MKLRQTHFTQEQLNTIDFLSKSTGLLKETISILFSRGYTDKVKVQNFLNPGKKNFHSPFLLSGMEDAVNRLETARENAEIVVVYGDYDVDGICSTTILFNTLKEYGIDVKVVIPERVNGYGLTEGVIDQVLETYCPDLIVTVDCGISSYKEVEYLKDLGVDVIVTDHHEIPETLPDCITVNCKLKNQDYPFDSLCGAGVAYKLAYALIGESADIYLDLVALATVADSMPLTSENRDLVVEGLNIIKNGNACLPLKTLITVSGMKDITSNALAYSVAPRINAAGRMGDAYSALKLFTSTSLKEIETLSIKLNAYNVQRQAECEFLYTQAKEQLLSGGNYGGVIVLYGENWNNGLLGITTAKLTEEYYLPTVMISKNGDLCHGSARSIEGVNIYESIDACKEYLVDFGGHSQAAGITITPENVTTFAKKLNEYILNNYGSEVFERVCEIDGYITEKFTMRLCREIDLMEPFGVDNKRPVFATEIKNANAHAIKPTSPHITFNNDVLEFMWFNGVNDLSLLNSDVTKTVIFEPFLNTFNGRQYLKGYVKSCLLNGEIDGDLSSKSLSLYFKNLKNYKRQNHLSKGEIQGLIDNLNPNGFGTLITVNNPKNHPLYNGLDKFEKCLFRLNVKGGKNALLIAGDSDLFTAKEYHTVISLDGDFLLSSGVEKVISSSLEPFDFSSLKVERDVFVLVYKQIVKWINLGERNYDYILENLSTTYSKEQAHLCLEVFNELGFITIQEKIQLNTNEKKDLEKSIIYNNAKNIIGGRE